jgi:hypothetical protein
MKYSGTFTKGDLEGDLGTDPGGIGEKQKNICQDSWDLPRTRIGYFSNAN